MPRFGHRPELNSFTECFKSIFMIHTETGNIWTHLIGRGHCAWPYGAGVLRLWLEPKRTVICCTPNKKTDSCMEYLKPINIGNKSNLKMHLVSDQIFGYLLAEKWQVGLRRINMYTELFLAKVVPGRYR